MSLSASEEAFKMIADQTASLRSRVEPEREEDAEYSSDEEIAQRVIAPVPVDQASGELTRSLDAHEKWCAENSKAIACDEARLDEMLEQERIRDVKRAQQFAWANEAELEQIAKLKMAATAQRCAREHTFTWVHPAARTSTRNMSYATSDSDATSSDSDDETDTPMRPVILSFTQLVIIEADNSSTLSNDKSESEVGDESSGSEHDESSGSEDDECSGSEYDESSGSDSDEEFWSNITKAIARVSDVHVTCVKSLCTFEHKGLCR